MNFHAIIAYIKYRWKAKGRHGTHSPFVYDFVEHVLRDREVIAKEYVVVYPVLPLRFENILSRITAYYQYRSVLFLPAEKDSSEKNNADLLLISAEAGKWQNLFDKHYSRLNAESAVVITDIHKTVEDTATWNKLCSDQRVRMSIDLYRIGILLFRKEFKINQQFVLKY